MKTHLRWNCFGKCISSNIYDFLSTGDPRHETIVRNLCFLGYPHSSWFILTPAPPYPPFLVFIIHYTPPPPHPIPPIARSALIFDGLRFGDKTDASCRSYGGEFKYSWEFLEMLHEYSRRVMSTAADHRPRLRFRSVAACNRATIPSNIMS